jgi:hypothetical protein
MDDVLGRIKTEVSACRETERKKDRQRKRLIAVSPVLELFKAVEAEYSCVRLTNEEYESYCECAFITGPGPRLTGVESRKWVGVEVDSENYMRLYYSSDGPSNATTLYPAYAENGRAMVEHAAGLIIALLCAEQRATT